MTTSRVGAVIDALVSTAEAAMSNVNVSDGFGVTGEPGDFLMIGVEDPDTEGAAQSATFTQTWAGLGANSKDEVGDITCAAVSWNGNGDQAAARNAALGIVANIEDALRTDPTLGAVVTSGWIDLENASLSQAQTEDGADAVLIFHIGYKARI